jgi:hypothetical protein
MRYILETELTGLGDELNVEDDGKGEVKNDSQVSGFGNWVIGIAVYRLRTTRLEGETKGPILSILN